MAETPLEQEIRLNQVYDDAVMAAEKIVIEGARSAEELTYLTARVALRYSQKVESNAQQRMLTKWLLEGGPEGGRT